MGTVKCEWCGGHVEANSIEQAYDLIDHAVGLSSGHGCGPGVAELVMVGQPKPEPKVEKVEEKKVETSKATKSSKTEAF